MVLRRKIKGAFEVLITKAKRVIKALIRQDIIVEKVFQLIKKWKQIVFGKILFK